MENPQSQPSLRPRSASRSCGWVRGGATAMRQSTRRTRLTRPPIGTVSGSPSA